MRLHILVEGPSEKAFLDGWLPRLLPGHTFRIHPHQGKGQLAKDLDEPPDPKHRGLLDQLPAKLRAFGKSLNPDTDRVLILVDADDLPCERLKKQIAKALRHCSPKLVALIRIAVEETEAFFLGDPRALKRAYPRARIRLLKRYQPDSICGTWEFLRDVLNEPPNSDDKVTWAEQIGKELGIAYTGADANRSPSFCQLCRALLILAGETPDQNPRRRQ